MIGDRNSFSGRIRIVDYDPQWPGLFDLRSSQNSGSARAARIEHMGSTAVPGLAAKPTVDILLVVADSSDQDAYVPRLETWGYVLCIREPGWHDHRMFKGPDTDVNLHVFSMGCPEIERILLFREWLRTHPADADLYARTKVELARREWTSVDDYANAKTATIAEILARARDPLYS